MIRERQLGTAETIVALLDGVARRDTLAFSELYRATSGKLYGIVLRILPGHAVADEVIQDVYVKIWEKAKDFDPSRASPITWMAAIARNRAIDELRHRKPDTLQALDDAAEMVAPVTDPLELRARTEQWRALLRCLDTIESDRRDLVLLAYYRGMTREALAERFGRPVATIKTWLHRSLSQIRLCLSQ